MWLMTSSLIMPQVSRLMILRRLGRKTIKVA